MGLNSHTALVESITPPITQGNSLVRFVLVSAFVIVASIAQATAIEEVNYWRERNGLPLFQEVSWMTAAAQRKAEYRAARLLKDSHQGPKCPAGCREGTGEATPWWGWWTCCMEETGRYAGAGVALGSDGERYMVLIVYGIHGRAPIGRRIRPLSISHLTPHLPIIPLLSERKVTDDLPASDRVVLTWSIGYGTERRDR